MGSYFSFGIIAEMVKSLVQTRQSRYLHCSIRELLALALIVALAISLYLANAEKSELKRKLNVLFPRPHVWLHDVSPLEEMYSTNASIALTGQLYPNCNFSSKTPTVSAKLLDPTTGKILCEVSSSVNIKGSFGFTVSHGQNLGAGFYPILVEIFDGKERIAQSTSTVQLVNSSGTKD